MPEQVQTEIRDVKTGATLATVGSYYGPTVVEIKRLGWRALEDAAARQVKDQILAVRDMGGVEAVTEFRKLVEANKKAGDDEKSDLDVARELAEAEKKRNPLAAYDTGELCLRGIVTIDGAEKTREQVDDLETEVVTAIATAVLRLARPGLFETEDARKNA